MFTLNELWTAKKKEHFNQKTRHFRLISVLCFISCLSLLVFCSCVSLTPQIEKPESSPDQTTKVDVSVQKSEPKADIQVSSVQNTLVSNNIRGISSDDATVWIATDSGVTMFNRTKDSWKYYTKEDGLGSDNINAVAVDGNWVWFGTDDGVSRYDKSKDSWRTFKSKDGLKGSKVLCITVARIIYGLVPMED